MKNPLDFSLKFRVKMPMSKLPMANPTKHSGPAATLGAAALLLLALGALPAEAAKKKAIPMVEKEEVKPAPPQPAPAPDFGESGELFQEIEFGSTLIIEGKVEKPQVQFTLLKEPPPEKEIRFETSFLQNILKQERENTFDPKERYGRD